MSDILQYHMRPAGLGILIIELSVLLASNKIIHAFVPAEYDCQSHMLYDFKRIFKIGDDRSRYRPFLHQTLAQPLLCAQQVHLPDADE